MKLNKKLGFSTFFIVLLLLLISNVTALGVSPARKIIDFEPNSEGAVDLKIINNDHKDIKVIIYAEGGISDKITFEKNELIFNAVEGEKLITYNYLLPDKFDVPGPHDTNIVIREIPIQKASTGAFIGGSVAVIHELRVNVPYPGKFATAGLKIAETNLENQVDFLVTVNSLGTQKIVNAKGIIDIFGPTNEKIISIETNSDSIDAGERKDLKAAWKNENVNPGKYYAKLTLVYDGSVSFAERIFDIGELLIDIIDINVRDFRLGQIARFNILVENKWSDLVKDVYVELIISEDGVEIGRSKSASEDISSLSKEELTAFWDTAGVEEGEYGAKAVLYYEDKSIEKDMRAIISLNSFRFDLFGSGAVVADQEGLDKNDVIVIALVVLVAINAFWFFYFKKKRK